MKLVRLSSLLFLILSVSCQNTIERRNRSFVKQIEKIGIELLLHIAYDTRGEKEYYSYYDNDSNAIHWSYNLKINQFEYPQEHELDKISETPLEFVKELRNQIKTLNVRSISQSPWPCALVRFWINNYEIISFVNPNFQATEDIKDDPKRLWLNDLQSGNKIKENWYYTKLPRE